MKEWATDIHKSTYAPQVSAESRVEGIRMMRTVQKGRRSVLRSEFRRTVLGSAI